MLYTTNLSSPIHNVDTQPLQTKSLDTLEHCMYVEELTTYVHKK